MNWVIYIIYSALWKTVRILPEKFADHLFSLLARLAYFRNGKRVKRLRKNYASVAPEISGDELEEKVRLGLKSAMRYWCDTFRISDWSPNRISSTVKTINEQYLLGPIQDKRGLIVALPHAGNWDHAGAYFCSKGIRVNTVAEHLKPEKLFRKFLEHREAMGMRVLDLNARVFNDLENILRSGELVALVADRDLSKSGIDVEFFGKIARMPAGPALLAYKTKCDLITAYVSYDEAGISIRFTAPIEINYEKSQNEELRRVTQVLAKQFESDIRSDMTSWHMQQRIFIDEDFVERS